MPQFTEMDAQVTLRQQMETDVSPVVLINRFTVAPEEVDQLLKAWAADAAFLKKQPGYISYLALALFQQFWLECLPFGIPSPISAPWAARICCSSSPPLMW